MSNNFVVYWGIGCCKIFVVCVCLVFGNGMIIINGCLGDNYLNYNFLYIVVVKVFLEIFGFSSEYDIFVNVYGGGFIG